MPSSQQWKKANSSVANGSDNGGFSLEQGDNGAANAAPGASSQSAAALQTSLVIGQYTEATISSAGGMTIDLDFINADHPTANFEADVEKAALVLSQAIHNNITVNLTVGYGEVEGTPLTNGSAAAGPDAGLSLPYSTVRAALLAHATPGDPNISDFTSLPTGSTIQGYSQVEVWSAEAKALGLMSATNPAIDGSAGFAVGIPDSEMVGLAVHELTHALGRFPDGAEPDIFDLSRFTGPGERLVSSAIPSAAAYFSVNGGQSALASYGTQSDPSDFLNASAPNDPFDEFYNPSTIQGLTKLDLTQMDVLGFNVSTAAHVAPTVNVRSFTVAENTAVAESAFVTGVTNRSNDGITVYAFRNAGTDGHLTSNGMAVQNGLWTTVAASGLGAIGYVGGATPGNDTLQVEVFDATTGTWSTPGTLTATTYAPHIAPTVDVRNFSLRELSSVGESAFFTGMSDPSGDSITAYAFWDGGGANGQLTVGGVAQKDGQWNVVGASQLGSVGYAGGAKAGSESLFVDAYDATTGSWTAYAGLTATTFVAPIMRTTELFTNAIASMTTSGGPNLGASVPNEPQSSPIHLASAH